MPFPEIHKPYQNTKTGKKKKNTKTGKSSAVKSLNLTLLGFKIKETLTYMYNSVENT